MGAELHKLPVPGHWIGLDVFRDVRARLGLCRCGRCGFNFVNPRPGSALLERFYSSDNYYPHSNYFEGNQQRKFALVLKFLEQTFGQVRGKRLLDFGCGGGNFLLRAAERGWEVGGVEIGQRGLATCAQLGLTVTNQIGDYRPGTFHCVTMIHVLEQLDDLGQVISSLVRLLAPGGRVFIEIPNLSSLRAKVSTAPLRRYFNCICLAGPTAGKPGFFAC
jgi:2-polyprenyl-3-methyl-5-hydroxy-6-metoxy-1,4-benzoquinol methylase